MLVFCSIDFGWECLERCSLHAGFSHAGWVLSTPWRHDRLACCCIIVRRSTLHREPDCLSDLEAQAKRGVPECWATLYRANADLMSGAGCAVCEKNSA